MPIAIVPHGDDKKALVERFNRRMQEGGSPWGFYVAPEPPWIPPRKGQRVWRELYLAVERGDHGEACVGGFALKPQAWLVHGRERTVTDWQGPVSLGAIDNRYATMGLRMLRDMLKRQPLLYSWGHGDDEAPMVRMLRKMGWLMHPTPFLLRVCRPARFLRRNGYLRRDRARALAQDLLAISGLGSVGIHALHEARALLALGARRGVTAEVVPRFSAWADALWARVKDDYAALAIRDAATMNALVPEEHVTEEWPAPSRLRIRRAGRDVGWAVVLERALRGDPRFGDLRVGMIADTLAAPADAAAVVHAAFSHLRRRGVDLVVANQAHPRWIAGFEAAGFVALKGRRLFCASPQLEEALQPWERTREGLLLSNLDGHGPML
jgi:hypothetical protein